MAWYGTLCHWKIQVHHCPKSWLAVEDPTASPLLAHCTLLHVCLCCHTQPGHQPLLKLLLPLPATHTHNIIQDHGDLEPASCFTELLCVMLISWTIVQRAMGLLSGYQAIACTVNAEIGK
jgi:hypothetical protein